MVHHLSSPNILNNVKYHLTRFENFIGYTCSCSSGYKPTQKNVLCPIKLNFTK